MRRGFWLMTGAVIGVASYRKATRLARTLAAQPGRPQLASAAGFVREVRAGMADYRAQHEQVGDAAHAGTNGGAHGRPGGGTHAGANGGADQGAPAAVGYRALRSGELSRSLGSRGPEYLGDRARPGLSQRGPREH
jgi:hypothetical protein